MENPLWRPLMGKSRKKKKKVHCDYEKGSQNQHFQSTLLAEKEGATQKEYSACALGNVDNSRRPLTSLFINTACLHCPWTSLINLISACPEKEDCKYLISNTPHTNYSLAIRHQSGLYDKHCLARFPTGLSQMALNKTQTQPYLHNDPHNINHAICN